MFLYIYDLIISAIIKMFFFPAQTKTVETDFFFPFPLLFLLLKKRVKTHSNGKLFWIVFFSEITTVLINLNMYYLVFIFIYFSPCLPGERDSFRLLKKTSASSLVLDTTSNDLSGKQMVQFQVSSINVVGESNPCFPKCIRLLKCPWNIHACTVDFL